MASKQNRLSLKQKEDIITLLDAGLSKAAVANQLSIAWKQVDYWSKNRARLVESVYTGHLKCPAAWHVGSSPTPRTKSYAYLLGCYLGDGYINKQGKYTWKLQFACDRKYPNIIEQIGTAFTQVFDRKYHFVKSSSSVNCVILYGYSKEIQHLFPLFEGKKHESPLVLESWQRDIIDTHPQEFLKGLYHTDGSRYIHAQGNLKHIHYNFTNKSKDIIDLFCESCDKLDIEYRINERPFINTKDEVSTGWTVTIGKRAEVERCEILLGKK